MLYWDAEIIANDYEAIVDIFISDIRKMQKFMSLRGIANECGIAASTLSRILNKTVEPKLSTMNKVYTNMKGLWF